MELELAAMSDGDSDDAIDWEADASESDDEAPAPRPPDAHPRAPEAPGDAAPPPKRRKVSYREAQAAKQRRESRVLVHKACVVCFLGRLRLLSRWCDDDVATTAKRIMELLENVSDSRVRVKSLEFIKTLVFARLKELTDAAADLSDLATEYAQYGDATAEESDDWDEEGESY